MTPNLDSSTGRAPRLKVAATRQRLLFRTALGLLITTGLVLFLARYLRWEQMVDLAGRLRWPGLLVGFALYLLLYWVRTYRFRAVAPRTPLTLMLCITTLHTFLLRVMPLRMGDLSFGFLVQRAGTAGLGHSLLALFLVRLLDATIVLVIFAATLAFNSTLYKGDLRLSILVTVAIAVLGIASIMSFGVMLRLALRILRRAAGAHWARHRPRTQQLLRRLVDALETHSQFDRALVLKLAALTTLNWLCNFSIVYTVMRTFSVDVSFAQAVLGGTACTVVGFLPVASIGSFGVMEAGWALGFVLVGLPSSLAVASGFAYSLVTFGYAIVLAGVAWIAFGRLAAATRVPKSDDPHPT